MRRRPVRKVEHHFVDITPTPSFRRIISFDDRVPGCAKMFGGVSVWRLIAAPDMAAGAADPQVQPGVAQFQAFFAPGSTRNNVTNFHQMFAKKRHGLSLLACSPCSPGRDPW